MRSILLQSRRISSRSLLLPHLSSPSSSSSLPRRFNSSTPSVTKPPPSNTIAPSNPSLIEPESLSSPSLVPPSRRAPPPPLRVSSPSSRPKSPAQRAAPTPSSPSKPTKHRWWSQEKMERRRALATALVERFGGDLERDGWIPGSLPDIGEEARQQFRDIDKFPLPTDEDLRLYSAIYVKTLTSPAPSKLDFIDYARHLRTLLFLYVNRAETRSKSFIGSLRSVLEASSFQEDLGWKTSTFRLFAVDLAAGATNASEAVEIVEGLRRLSPSSFTESQFEELLQAIGQVEDWTTTTRNTFELPSFPTPVEFPSFPTPLELRVQSPLQTSSAPSKPPTTRNSPPPSLKPPKPAAQPSSPSPIPHSPSPPSSTSPPSSSSPSSSPSPVTPKRFLEFSRLFTTAPPPSASDLLAVKNLYEQAYPPRKARDPKLERTESLINILRFASRAPLQPSSDRYVFGGLVSIFVRLLEDHASVDAASFDLDVKKDLLPLLHHLNSRGQVGALARNIYRWKKEDLNPEEMDTIKKAMLKLPEEEEARQRPQVVEDWENGFGARLSELMESSSSRSSERTDAEWLAGADTFVLGTSRSRGVAYGHLQARPVDAKSTSESLVVASKLFTAFAPSNHAPPLNWRQHGAAVVSILLLFSNHQTKHPPSFFSLLAPALRDVHRLPPSFIPSTPSFPSFAIPLLTKSTNPNDSLLIVNCILRAQQHDSTVILQLWSTFLSALERHSIPASPSNVSHSTLFQLVRKAHLSGAVSPTEDLIGVQLRRWRRVQAKAGKLEREREAFNELERLVEKQTKGDGVEYGSSLFSTMMEALVVVKKDWEGVFRVWERVQEGAGVDAKAVEMYLVACLETSSLGRATSLFTTIQSNPSMLPLLSPQTWSTYYSLLLKGKDLSSLVEAVVFQVASKEENTSPLAAEVLAKVVELAREVGGERGAEAEEKLKKAVGEERFEEAVKSSGGKGGE